MQQAEKWTSAEAYASIVAAKVVAALGAAGLRPCDIGGEPMEDVLIHHERPLTVRHLEIAARWLGVDPSGWMRR